MDTIYERLEIPNDREEYADEPSEIQNFFSGQTIFLTGCTGFLGKLLVEKLLRSCADIKMLYLMVRPKKVPTNQRMKEYFNHVIFDRMKVENPNFQSKISIVEGDLLQENLGLSAEVRAKLINETTIIYHNASNVKFDVKLNLLIRVNVLGTKYVLDLARDCKNVIAFSYISTAYSHCYQKQINEKFYPPPGDLNFMKNLMTTAESTPDGFDEKAMQSILGPWPNGYAFTKSAAENLVEEFAKEASFACIVFRPSMVVSTYLEPIRGWCGNINGPVAAVVGACLGFIHAAYKSDTPIDYVPGDMCANAMIVTVWDAIVNRKNEKEGIVYNYASATVKPISVKDFGALGYIRGADMPSVHMMGPYFTTYTKSWTYYWFLHLTLHLMTAVFADLALLSQNKKPQALGFWMQLTKNLNWLNFFINGNWRFHIHNMRAVWSRMSRRDGALFFCDLNKLDWGEFAYAYWPGLRMYIVKDPISTREEGLKKRRKLETGFFIINWIFRLAILYYVGLWLLRILQFHW
ncbi:fatty acyl-CoA reductase wat-like [Venturia canescens]|uniref:fatty acyl-CoA reductase wat-like n=1 Tax=Venturia canescens TaxID=32260 RepID=UPI001C9CF2DE|nr:fatty acyl-CoA reductase wat-like [Venturia canescens]